VSLLEVKAISKRFGGVQAVKDVSFTVPEGAVKAVIGPNGAGKTTLFDLLSGFRAPDTGTVLFRGHDIHGRPAHEVAALGLCRTFQNLKLFGHMTALENVMVGRHVRSRAGMLAGMLSTPAARREEREIEERSRAEMRFLGVEGLAASAAGSLAYGQQRAVELARALCAEPSLLLLDEPAAGLNMRETNELAEQILRIRERGVTVLLVEHDMSLVMRISDEVAVLCFGQKIADADPRSVQGNPEVIRVYLGDE
jgi:branched-chain amino acid transport system ATP-binding protein